MKIPAFDTHLRGDLEMFCKRTSRLIIFMRRETARWKPYDVETKKNTV